MIILKRENESRDFGDIDVLKNHLFMNGRHFPDSYINFVEEYGYGLSLNLFLIYIPMGSYGDSIFERSEGIKATYKDALNDEDELWFDLEPDLSYDRLGDMYLFAASENGHYLFWDLESGDDKEFDIYITDFRGVGFTRVSGSLYEFFEKITSNKFKEILPFSIGPLEKVFKPLCRV
jgi:hypothetical protein